MKTQNQCRMPVVTVKVHNNYIQKSFPKPQRRVQRVTKIIVMCESPSVQYRGTENLSCSADRI